LCQPTECHIPNLEPDPEFDCWIREHVNQDNDRAVPEHERVIFRGYPGYLASISDEFAFLSDKLGLNKSPNAGLGHSILQYLAEMKVMLDHGEDTIAHEASVQVRFGAEAARHNVVVAWARNKRHSQVIQLRKKKSFGYIALSVSYKQSHIWFPKFLPGVSPRPWIRFLVYDSYYAHMIPIMWRGYSDSRMPLH